MIWISLIWLRIIRRAWMIVFICIGTDSICIGWLITWCIGICGIAMVGIGILGGSIGDNCCPLFEDGISGCMDVRVGCFVYIVEGAIIASVADYLGNALGAPGYFEGYLD